MSSDPVNNISCALVTGAGGGIGKAIARYLITRGKKVILAGRTEANLVATAREIGASAYGVLDVGIPGDIAPFVQRLVTEHPDLDCLVNNAGVQRHLDIVHGDVDDFLSRADQEIDINVRGTRNLTQRLLSHLRWKPHAMIVNLSSIVAFVPFRLVNPVYNGTKGWVHLWTMNLRAALARAGSNIHVVEIAPPTVGTDLHREAPDPDDNKKDKNLRSAPFPSIKSSIELPHQDIHKQSQPPQLRSERSPLATRDIAAGNIPDARPSKELRRVERQSGSKAGRRLRPEGQGCIWATLMRLDRTQLKGESCLIGDLA
ncbi:NAD(P)-binding protein [Aspergillus heteromorphus CBS 117.55]|uniref:NAD(P)-binding protein n=1 Tax=Aspergillus heteromorphus CBS 117.55 TaxID=1448321 RepID=A0A317W9N1_9EURO|nr:NAD(P)-binding protein [Aspergillus heteromorphus CBS 117.55]PWY82027.1 NAD(P)-binding protein [Aspergillus heteromorphus CBS 117.55]